MNLRPTGFVLWVLAGPLAWATPPQVTNLDERLLGENGKEFSVLRIEDDNLGSYYQNRQKVSLVERSKETGKDSKETLLTDITTTVDAGHDDPTTPPAVTATVHEKDDALLLGDVFERFPLVPERPLEPALRERFRVVDEEVVFGERLKVLTAKRIAQEVFDGRVVEIPVRLEDAKNVGATIYLKLSKEDESEGGKEAHWVAVPSEIMRQMRALHTRESVYLAAGSFPTAEEARKQAALWQETCRGKKIFSFWPEIWSAKPRGNEKRFVVVLKDSTDLIRSEKFAGIGEALGVVLQPIAGETLLELAPAK